LAFVTIFNRFPPSVVKIRTELGSTCSSSQPHQIYTLLFGGFSSSEPDSEDILHFITQPVPVGWKECVAKRFSPRPSFAGLFRHYRPLAASQVTRRKDMEVLHKFAQPYILYIHLSWCLVDPPKTCGFVVLIKPCHLLTSFFFISVNSLAGHFDGVYYIFTGENTSKADKLNNFRSMKILNTPLKQKSLGIHTKRHVLEQTHRTKGCKFGWAWRMNVCPCSTNKDLLPRSVNLRMFVLKICHLYSKVAMDCKKRCFKCSQTRTCATGRIEKKNEIRCWEWGSGTPC